MADPCSFVFPDSASGPRNAALTASRWASFLFVKTMMTNYLISFPSAAMNVPDDQLQEVGRAAAAVIDEAKAAGVFVFAGGINEALRPALVSSDGKLAQGGYAWAPALDGGFTVLALPSYDDAVAWAARLAKACRCDQELRAFQFDLRV